MALSDALLANLPSFYVAVIVAIKAYSLVSDRNFGAAVLVIASIGVVLAALVLALSWDISRRAAEAISRYNRRDRENSSHRRLNKGGSCHGGICWHGLAVRSPASKVRFRLPQHIQ